MNKKGFTLIEILVVITLIATVGISSYIVLMNSMKKSTKGKYENLASQIEDAADVYLSLNNELYNCVLNGTNIKISLNTLKLHGYVNDSLINPLTNAQFSNDCFVKASLVTNSINYSFSCDQTDTTSTSC